MFQVPLVGRKIDASLEMKLCVRAHQMEADVTDIASSVLCMSLCVGKALFKVALGLLEVSLSLCDLSKSKARFREIEQSFVDLLILVPLLEGPSPLGPARTKRCGPAREGADRPTP